MCLFVSLFWGADFSCDILPRYPVSFIGWVDGGGRKGGIYLVLIASEKFYFIFEYLVFVACRLACLPR